MTFGKSALLIVAAATAVLIAPLPALAAPPLQGDCPGNLLVNAGFEDGFSTRGAGEVTVANGWQPWWHNGLPAEVEQGLLRRPEYKGEDARVFGTRRVRSGYFAQKWFTTYSTHNGGIFQRVSVPAGSLATFSAWAQAWSSEDPDPGSAVKPGNYKVSVGIDPTGGTDGLAPTVVWSEEVVQYNTWLHLQVQAKAQADAVTVFLRGRPEYRTRFNDSYWDDACLTIVRPTPRATNTPRPTNTPTITPIPPTPTATPTPLPVSIALFAFEDVNQSGTHDAGEGMVAGAAFTVKSAAGAAVAEYATDGKTEPKTFGGLPAGDYIVTAQLSGAWLPVGPTEWTLTLAPGQIQTVMFAARFVPTPTPTRTVIPTRTPTPAPTPTPASTGGLGDTLYQISGFIALALAAGLSVGLYLRRRGK